MQNLKNIQKLMKTENLDLIVLLDTGNIREPITENILGKRYEESVLVIKKSGKLIFFASPLVMGHLKAPEFVKVVDIRKAIEFFKKFKRIKIGVNQSRMPLRFAKKLQKVGRLVEIDDALANIVAIKEDSKIKKIKSTVKETENILRQLFLKFNKFYTETDIASFLKNEASVFDGLAFDTIVASGKNASIPHAIPQKTKLKNGFCIIDFGIKFKGCLSDLSRTIYIGSPKLSELRLFENVVNARDNAFKTITPGIKANVVDKVARDILGTKLVHSLGHGVGVEIHEPPFLSPKSEDTLKKNMVFTLEPGYYDNKKGIGIRVEDMVLLKDKPRWLSSAPRSLLRVR